MDKRWNVHQKPDLGKFRRETWQRWWFYKDLKKLVNNSIKISHTSWWFFYLVFVSNVAVAKYIKETITVVNYVLEHFRITKEQHKFCDNIKWFGTGQFHFKFFN